MIFLFTLAALCGTRAYTGLYGTRIYSHDAFMVLDGAWRMIHGQRPHVDFNSMIGPMAYVPAVIGLWMSGYTASGFGYGLALAGVVIGVWAYLLGSRLHPVLRILFSLFAAGVALSPATVGPSPFAISPGMTYNRLSYGLLALLLLECLQPEDRLRTAGGVSTGVALALLSFTKMTAGATGLVLVLAYAFVVPKSRARGLGVLFGFAGGALPFLVYLHFRIHLMLKDLALTAAAKHIAFAERYDLNTVVFEAAMALAIVFGIALWHCLNGRRSDAKRLQRAGLVTVVASVLLIFANFQRSELPLAVFLILIAINEFTEYSGTDSSVGLLRVNLMTGTAYVASTLFALLCPMLLGIFARVHTVRYASALATPALSSFVPIGEDYDFARVTNDGMALLEKNRMPGEHVMALAFTNPFSLGLKIPPAPGGTTNLQYRGSFDLTHYLPAEDLFGRAELVTVPVRSDDPGLNSAISELYGGYLHGHYTVVAKSEEWDLYRRNTGMDR